MSVRCCLTPMICRDDERVSCLCCGWTFSDRVSMSERVRDAINRLDDRDDPPITHRSLNELRAIRDRVLAEIAATPSVVDIPRRGAPVLDRCRRGHDDWHVKADGTRYCGTCHNEQKRAGRRQVAGGAR